MLFPTETVERRQTKESLKDSRSLLKRSRSSSPGGKLLSKLTASSRSISGGAWKSYNPSKPKKIANTFGPLFTGITSLLTLSPSETSSKRDNDSDDCLWDINYFSICPDAAVSLPMESKQIGFEKGFSVSFWIKRLKSFNRSGVNKNNELGTPNVATASCSHVLSVGYESLLCSLVLR